MDVWAYAVILEPFEDDGQKIIYFKCLNNQNLHKSDFDTESTTANKNCANACHHQ